MTALFTPGPWTQGVMGTSEAETQICYVRSDACSLDEVMRGNADICLCQSEANACLIAAAPELLEALKQLVEMAHNTCLIPEHTFAVIAKAEGRSDA